MANPLVTTIKTIKKGVEERKPTKKKKKPPVRQVGSKRGKGGELGSGAAQNVINKKREHKKRLESHTRKEMKGRK